MVTTRRNAAAPAEDTSALERRIDVAPTPSRTRRAARKATQATPQPNSQSHSQTSTTTTATATTATSHTSLKSSTVTTTAAATVRRTRSKATASPLKQLEEPKRNVQKSAPKKTTLQSKRKRGTSNYAISNASATPEPESVHSQPVQDENDDQGIFFTQSMALISSSPQNPPEAFPKGTKWAPVVSPSPIPAVPSELDTLREENLQLRDRISQLEWKNQNLVDLNNSLHDQIYHVQTGQVNANTRHPSDFDDLPTMRDTEPSPIRPEFVRGSDSALALLHQIENAARESRATESKSQTALTQSSRLSQPASTKSGSSGVPTNATPRTTPSSFFSRSFSAIKSRLGFSTPTPSPAPAAPEAAAASPTPSRAPPADTLTEALSGPPTPIGERSKALPKKPKQSAMLRLLTKGVDASDKVLAEKWAKNILPSLKNDNAFSEKRKRLETPVLVKDLDNFPSSKPWESGFGDPLGDMDDDDVVPVWAVYLDLLARDEEPKTKKRKSTHEVTMDVEDTPSLNDLFAASGSAQSSPSLHDSHGRTASDKDFHPRRSVEPSPMFESPVSHQKGKNIFRELQGHDATAQSRADDLETLQQATKDVVPTHDPTQGSFGLDYDSDDEDTTMLSETSSAEATDPVWTQPPPPAPVPAHAPLPGGSSAETTASSTQQPVDEIERQRQKLMKHTPAKPSRLREAFVPSPSLMSDAGNESILISTPLAAADPFGDMPEAEDLGLDEEEWAAVEALKNSAEWQAANADNVWPDPIITYDSDEEEMSSE